MEKNFKLTAEDIQQLIEPMGACIATNMILVEGMKVGYMYRDVPRNEYDSGWCFTAGTEDDEYMDDPNNHGIYDVNTITNYDRSIIPLLDAPYGTAWFRDEETGEFEEEDFPDIED